MHLKVLWTALNVFSMQLGGNRRWVPLSFENNDNKKRCPAHKFYFTISSETDRAVAMPWNRIQPLLKWCSAMRNITFSNSITADRLVKLSELRIVSTKRYLNND